MSEKSNPAPHIYLDVTKQDISVPDLVNLFLKLCIRQNNALISYTNACSIATHLNASGELCLVNGGESFLTTVPNLLQMIEQGKAKDVEEMRMKAGQTGRDLRGLAEIAEDR